MSWFRTYSPDWTLTGWSPERQYPGQMESRFDWPVLCEHCGKRDVVGVNIMRNPACSHQRGTLPAGFGYAATCRCGHVMYERPISELVNGGNE